ncbi:hypothetical protein D3C84_1151470 [compost metagenome]
MPLLDRFIRQVDLKDLTERLAIGHPVKTERTDQQMHIQRLEAGTEHTLFSAAPQDHAQGIEDGIGHRLDRA